MAHHNLLGICHQLKIFHLYGTFNFSTQCISMGTGILFAKIFVERHALYEGNRICCSENCFEQLTGIKDCYPIALAGCVDS